MKPKLLHFIFNLGRGGAETLVVNVVESMKDYDHTIVTLFDINHFKEETKGIHYVSLNLKLYHLIFFPFVALRFRKLVRNIQPDIVHAHLLWPVVIARMSVPASIPLVTTIHGYVSQLVDYRKWYFRWLDRWSFKRRPSTVLAVSKGALQEYLDFLKHPPQQQRVLYTFVDTSKFIAQSGPTSMQPFRLISVGALRYQKNQSMLVEMMKHFKGQPVELDIYGAGDLEEDLKKQIETSGVAVHLKGQVSPIQKVLPKYHAMIMSSHYEGFSIGVLEAMAMKVPLVLSNIPSFKEQCGDAALYFDLDNIQSAVKAVKEMIQQPHASASRTEKALQLVHQHYTKQHHLNQLNQIYQSLTK